MGSKLHTEADNPYRIGNGELWKVVYCIGTSWEQKGGETEFTFIVYN